MKAIANGPSHGAGLFRHCAFSCQCSLLDLALFYAQSVTATINGTSPTPQGTSLPNADVTATDLDRGTVWPAKTNGSGFYSLSHLPVGRYEVRVTAPVSDCGAVA